MLECLFRIFFEYGLEKSWSGRSLMVLVVKLSNSQYQPTLNPPIMEAIRRVRRATTARHKVSDKIGSTGVKSGNNIEGQVSLDPVPIHFNSRMSGVKELSNFAPCVIDGRSTTVEHEYQALKMEVLFGDIIYANHIRSLATPQEAKKAGSMGGWVAWMKTRRLSLSPSVTKEALKHQFKEAIKTKWIPQSMSVMRGLLEKKFNPLTNPTLWHFLDSTENRPLHEVGRPNVWTKSGQDMLGKHLVEVRFYYRHFVIA